MQNETAFVTTSGSLDQEMLEGVFDEYAPILYKYLLRLGVGPKEADQTVGDVFLRLLEKISEGKGPRTNVRAYLFQTAYHLVVDNSREMQRIATLDAADTRKEHLTPVQTQTEEKMSLEILSAAMARELTEEQRNVLVLRYQEDFSLKETAEIMGKKINAIKALQSRAIKRLREAMSSGSEGE